MCGSCSTAGSRKKVKGVFVFFLGHPLSHDNHDTKKKLKVSPSLSSREFGDL